MPEAPTATPDMGEMVLPDRFEPRAAATQILLRRTGRSYLALAAAGLLPVLARRSGKAQTAGLGLVAPGGGYAASARPVKAAATVGATVLSGANMLVTGNVVLPPAIWIGSALHAAFTSDEVRPRARWAVPAGAAAVAAAGVAFDRRRAQTREQTRVRRNGYLRMRARPFIATTSGEPERGPALDDLQTGLMRTFYDLSMQPEDSWEGYTKIDQFREAAYRYQLTLGQYAMAIAQATRMPSFDGVLAEAQRRSILKHQQPIVWSYWFWENLWGNLSVNADPMRHKNIMLSGWLAQSLGLYEEVTGDHAFDADGALVFQGRRGRFEYGYDQICKVLVKDLDASPYGLSDCEPGWTFTVCNLFSLTGLLLHDRIHGSDHWERVRERALVGLRQDFLTRDGHTVTVRNSRLGTCLGPTQLMTDAQLSVHMRPLDPVTGDRLWEIVREEFLDIADGRLKMKTVPSDFIDPGNYRTNNVGLLAAVITGANEAGDTEIAKFALDTLLHDHPPRWTNGAVRFDGISVLNHGMLLRAILGLRGSWVDLVTQGMPDRFRKGPRVVDVPFPHAMVTRAISDGVALEVTLRPGRRLERPVEVTLAQLSPGKVYRDEATGHEVTTDASGGARWPVDLSDPSTARTLRLVPLT